jgi:hypothetical protein
MASLELTKNRQAEAKKLKDHIKRTEAQMQNSQSRKVRYAKPELPKPVKSRILKLD